MTAKVLVIYDGDCRFCRFGIAWVRRLDGKNALSFCPFGNDTAEAHLSALPPGQRYETMHAVVSGRLYSGTDAARIVLEQLPLGRVAAALGLHRFYPLLVRSRALGRLVPDRHPATTCGQPPLVAEPDLRR